MISLSRSAGHSLPVRSRPASALGSSAVLLFILSDHSADLAELFDTYADHPVSGPLPRHSLSAENQNKPSEIEADHSDHLVHLDRVRLAHLLRLRHSVHQEQGNRPARRTLLQHNWPGSRCVETVHVQPVRSSVFSTPSHHHLLLSSHRPEPAFQNQLWNRQQQLESQRFGTHDEKQKKGKGPLTIVPTRNQFIF